jgi:hypothetical protein
MTSMHTPVRGETIGSVARESSWWTPERFRAAGVAGLVSGVGLTVVAMVHNWVRVEDVTSVAGTLSGFAHSIAYLMMLFALLGLNARYAASYGRLGRVLAYAIAAGFAALVPVFPLMSLAFGDGWVVGEAVAGAAFIVIHLLATVYGIVLWRRTMVNRVAAALLIAVIPGIVLVISLEALGVGGRLSIMIIEGPLYLGVAVLSFSLLRRDGEGVS